MCVRWVLLSFAATVFSVVAAPVDYSREIKPLLAENCYRCHGASQQRHGLRLDAAVFALKGGENGPAIQAGQNRASLLMAVIRGEHESLPRMPYKKAPLSTAQISLIARWIDEGAKAPANEEPEKSVHWSFVPPVRPEIPALPKSSSSARAGRRLDSPRSGTGTGARQGMARSAARLHPIDAFILAKLANEGIEPAPEADRITLIRRLSFDLIGLPPTTAEVDEFVNDRRVDAYERLVDRLLASPHHGERWGRHWLDVARYADSNGYSIDAPRNIWKYRDWVIAALNRDLPFDQFTLWQIAGDFVDTNSLPAGTGILEPLIATGFHRNTQINQEGGIDPEQFRVESVMDRVNTTATAWLGVTLACAQCHDHKFDPFTQRDYYQFYAFFNSTIEDGHGKGAPEGMLEIAGENESAEARLKELSETEIELDRYISTKVSDVVKWQESLTPQTLETFKSEVRKALEVPLADRTIRQKRIVYAAFRPDDADFKQRNAKLTRLEKNPSKPVSTLIMREMDKPRDTHVFIKGDFTRPAQSVAPGVPAILQSMMISEEPEVRSEEGQATRKLNRLDLARWLVDGRQPLTARVVVNRMWQQYFGRGLVETENDFGTQGSPPSHPELLDWLACELMKPTVPDGPDDAAGGHPRPWSLKHMHRLIVLSATYRQSSKARPELMGVDPNNRLLARQNRLRLDAEIIRDVCLAASGLLNERIGGPSVFPPQPDGVMNLGQSKREWKPSAGGDRYRRGMYTYFWRATPYPSLSVFDAADGFAACTRRLRSNTPLQALTLLNDEAFHECAGALASRVLREGPPNDEGRLDYAFRLCLSRRPARDERDRLLQLLASEEQAGEQNSKANATKAGVASKPIAQEKAAWTSVARVLVNLDETITRE
jgi:hypothetical protein